MLTRLNFKLQNPPKPLELQGSVTDQLSQLQDYINQSGKLSYDQARSIQKYLDDLNEKGALTISANSLYSSRGLQFPTAQGAAVSDPNTLDDYAEGTWTPTFTLATPGNLTVAYSSQIGIYTKLGRKVIAQFNLVCTPTFTTGSGALRIGGFAFTSGTTGTNLYGGPLTAFDGITKAGYSQYAAVLLDSSATISMVASGSGVAADNVNATSIVSGSALTLRGAVFLNV